MWGTPTNHEIKSLAYSIVILVKWKLNIEKLLPLDIPCDCYAHHLVRLSVGHDANQICMKKLKYLEIANILAFKQISFTKYTYKK